MRTTHSFLGSLLLLLGISILFFSCNTDGKVTASGTYLACEIVNPTQNYILLLKNNQITDSILLDHNNRFSYKFNALEGGLYHLLHGEYQILHIEEGDSILLRVNTKEFDESLTYSGYGATKNNFIINNFLHWEEENDFIIENKAYEENPADFEKLLDSMSIVHTRELTKFFATQDYSDSFKEIATAISTFNNYYRREQYPFSKYIKDRYTFFNSLPEGFYSFRNNIDINSKDLQELLSFRRYVNSYLNSLSYKKYGKDHPFDRTSYIHNHHVVYLIDSLIENDIQRERLLNQTARIFIANSNDLNEVSTLFKEIKKVSKSQKTMAALDASYESNKRLQSGNIIPDVLIKNRQGDSTSFTQAFKKPTVLYFWSYKRPWQMKNAHLKTLELQKKYPEFDFAAINIDKESEPWIKQLEKNSYTSSFEYQFTYPDEAIRIMDIIDLNKTIVIDKNMAILNSHANLRNSNFENELLSYLNQ